LENTRKDVNILQQKFENLNNLIDSKQNETKKINSPKATSNKKSESSSTSSISEKSIDKHLTSKLAKEQTLFQSLGLPDIFSLFNKSSVLNPNLGNPSNFENFLKHSKTINLEQISTSDDESEATSVILLANEKNKINNDLDIDKTEAYIDNDKQIEVYSNSEKTQKNEEADKSIVEPLNNETVNIVQPIVQPIENKSENVKEEFQIEVQTEQTEQNETNQVLNNEVTEDVNTTDVPTTNDATIDSNVTSLTNVKPNKKYTKNYLESLKLNDLKGLAKKHKVSTLIGKKLKNKTELINDLINF
jgi:hypothetical protein